MNIVALVTHQHIARVRQLLGEFAIEMIRRGDQHDASKFDPVEMGPLEELQKRVDAEGSAPFGSAEYERRKVLLGPMIRHHNIHNSHHPEHYETAYGGCHNDGINGMDLFDLVEMFFDWKAASERGQEVSMNLSFACDKYKITGPLRSILFNTAERLGYIAIPPASTNGEPT